MLIEREIDVHYSELLRLPYLDIVRWHLVDPVHNHCLGTAKHVTTLEKTQHEFITNGWCLWWPYVEQFPVPQWTELPCCSLFSGYYAEFGTHVKYSVGALYMVILKLPWEEQYKLENIILVAVIPGPKEPKKTVNSFLAQLIQELHELWDGVPIETSHGWMCVSTTCSNVHCIWHSCHT